MSTVSTAMPNNWRPETIKSHYEDVERVINEMVWHFEDGLTLNELADIAVMTPYHFNRVFRCVTGVPPCRFMWMLRLEAAKKLLVTTDRNVIDVCYDVGYSSLGTFTRRFTQLVGIPPLRFRHMATNGMVRLAKTKIRHSNNAVDLEFQPNGLNGMFSCPENFAGSVLIGLFKNPVPYEPPVSCTFATTNRSFRFDGATRGKFYLFAAGIKESTDALDSLLSERIFRGAAVDSAVDAHGCTFDQVNHVTLRAARLTDPPLLTCLPALVLRNIGDPSGQQPVF